ncbi:hypothetical protein Tco_0713928 [Tanacetum coccineum]
MLVKASIVVRPDPDELIRVPYEIHGKMCQLTNDEIQTHLDKEEKIKKAAEEAKLLAMIKPELIKVVHEEASNVEIDPKVLASAKGGQEFKKIQDLDDLAPITKKKKNKIVGILMISLGKRYERLKKIPGELGIQSALSAPAQTQSQSSGKKRKHMELEPEIRIPGLECNKSLPEGVPFFNNMVIEEPEYDMFFNDVFGDVAL